MDSRNDIREFLTTRRARITPERAGLPNFGGQRRVPGLRREEVALLAGMSVEYYVRLERGNALGVSEAVLEGISRALQLDEAEHAHLYDLVRAANSGVRPQRGRRARRQLMRPSMQQLLDAMSSVPAVVQNGRLDILGTNRLGAALFSELFVQPRRPVNFARFTFLEPRAQSVYRDWPDIAQQTVALLRAEAGRSPHDRELTDLVGELTTRSDHFTKLWASHDVREHRAGLKRMNHPVVGELDLNYEGMTLENDPGLMLIAYTAEPGSASSDGLRMLESWAATVEPVNTL